MSAFCVFSQNYWQANRKCNSQNLVIGIDWWLVYCILLHSYANKRSSKCTTEYIAARQRSLNCRLWWNLPYQAFKRKISKEYTRSSHSANSFNVKYNYRGSPHFVISQFVIPTILWFSFSENQLKKWTLEIFLRYHMVTILIRNPYK